MLYTYTPELVGGTIIYDLVGKFYRETLSFGDKLISITQREKDGVLTIIVFENRRTTKIISSVELEFHKHQKDDYFYPEEVKK